MQFDEREKTVAKSLPQQINNYFGTVIQGNVQKSQVVNGNNNEITYNKDKIINDIYEIRDSIENSDEMTQDDKETAIEILNDISNKIEQNKKQSIIKATLCGLRDFVISVGGQVVGTLIAAKLQGL